MQRTHATVTNIYEQVILLRIINYTLFDPYKASNLLTTLCRNTYRCDNAESIASSDVYRSPLVRLCAFTQTLIDNPEQDFGGVFLIQTLTMNTDSNMTDAGL